MVLDIKLCRFDNVPWGFRLVGGADYDYPLTVVKVAEGSIAEEAGLCVEDIIVRINDTAAMPLTHEEANYIIMNSGNVFFFGVYRENEEEAIECPKRFPLSCTTSESGMTMSPRPWGIETPSETTDARMPELAALPVLRIGQQQQHERHQQPNELEMHSMWQPHLVGTSDDGSVSDMQSEDYRNTLYLPDLPDRPCSVLSEQSEINLVEEEIAAVLSGGTEVLKEHNVLGIFPKPGVCMASDVLRSLNDELTKTKLEQERDKRKWSTFLQKPDRPVPMSKQQMEAERRKANAYKVKIVKSELREKSPMPEVKPLPKQVTPPPAEPEKAPEPELELEPVEEEPLPTDSEVPNLEQLPGNGVENGIVDGADKSPADVQSINSSQHNDGDDDGDEQLQKTDSLKDEQSQTNEQEQADATSISSIAAITPPKAVKSEEELALEKQLADVQKQLAALSTLPSTIQSTLDAVTKQLAELLPTLKLQQSELKHEKEQGQELPLPAAAGDLESSLPQIDEREEQLAAGEHTADKPAGGAENIEPELDKCVASDLEVAEISRSNGDNCVKEQQEALTEEQILKKQKLMTCQKHDVIEELEEQLVRKKNPKRSKRAFGPLTPSSERPLVLPGGRRWYRPKDAYNDEFIAETLSAQAELITGTTLGVNFMKYQKPERKIDLNHSEVYKVIHHLDRAPIRGIEVRAPLVAAESDIRQSLQS